jgi:hypothetical protein
MQSAMFSPTDIGLLPDDEFHSVAFKPGGTTGWFLSEPKEVRIERAPRLIQRAVTRTEIVSGLRSEAVEDWLRRLAAQMRRILQEEMGTVASILNRVDRYPLDDVAYLARVHFGSELFLFARPHLTVGQP